MRYGLLYICKRPDKAFLVRVYVFMYSISPVSELNIENCAEKWAETLRLDILTRF